MTSGCRLALAVYRAAVRPAGPEPRIMTSSTGMVISGRGCRSRCLHLLRLWFWGRRRLFGGHRRGVETLCGEGLYIENQAAAHRRAELADSSPHCNGVEGTDLNTEVAVHAEVVIDGESGRVTVFPLTGTGQLNTAGRTDPGAGLAGGTLELSGRLVDSEHVPVQ